MKIPECTLNIIRNIPVNDIISHYVQLKPSGSQFKGLCPFHDERTPSFSVRPQKGYNCFGCGRKGGDSIAFIMDYENMSFLDAVVHIAGMTGINISHTETTSNYQPPALKKIPPRFKPLPPSVISLEI